MLRHLVALAERLEDEGELIPPGYKKFSRSSPIEWVVEIDAHGEVSAREASIQAPRPSRQRSGKPSPTNLKPYLLADQARYALGVPEEDKEEEAELLHRGFRVLTRSAAEATGDSGLARIADRLEASPIHEDLDVEIGPRDVVTFSVGRDRYPFQSSAARSFWASFVEDEYTAEETGTCSVCGEERFLVQTLPQKVTLLGETCQITSFNLSAFRSYGREQTLNASLCYSCGARAAQVLNHLLDQENHRVHLARNPRDGASASLKDHLAVFWTDAEEVETEDGRAVDPRVVFQASAGGFDREDTPSEAEVEELLKVPWHAQPAALRGADPGAHLLVLSPNKARLVVREWLHESLEELRRNLRRYLRATRLRTPSGREARAFGVRDLLEALAVNGLDPDTGRVTNRREVEANEVRGLLTTAYSGFPPPRSLRPTAVRLLRNPNVWNAAPWLSQRLVAVLKLSEVLRTPGKERTMTRAERLESLDTDQLHPGYLCGRLLAVLEDAQTWAADGQLNTTLVDRNYTASATAPASALPRLLNQAETAHIPKIRRKSGGGSADWMREQIEKILAGLDAHDGFPRTLNNEEQGKFALGFYHQRARSRRRMREHSESSVDESDSDPSTERE